MYYIIYLLYFMCCILAALMYCCKKAQEISDQDMRYDKKNEKKTAGWLQENSFSTVYSRVYRNEIFRDINRFTENNFRIIWNIP